MFRPLGSALALAALAQISSAQSIAGIRVGDPTSVLQKLNLKPLARANTGATETLKYKLNNGNELSVTYDSTANRIVYVECDWDGNPRSVDTDLPNFRFGVTSLAQIRVANGSNGFSYKSTAMNTAGGELFTFNAYNVTEKPGLIAIFVTTLNIAELRRRRENKEPGAENLAENLKLDSLILAEESYLDEIWGKEKIYDKDAKPISWAGGTPTK